MTAHLTTVRVRYVESDQMGYVHHSAYVLWLEMARIEWLRSIGISYAELEASGILMPVVELNLAYRQPLHFDDLIDLHTEVEIVGPTRARFTTRICLHGHSEPRATGTVVIASVTDEGKPTRLPAVIGERLGSAEKKG